MSLNKWDSPAVIRVSNKGIVSDKGNGKSAMNDSRAKIKDEDKSKKFPRLNCSSSCQSWVMDRVIRVKIPAKTSTTKPAEEKGRLIPQECNLTIMGSKRVEMINPIMNGLKIPQIARAAKANNAIEKQKTSQEINFLGKQTHLLWADRLKEHSNDNV